MNKIYHYIIGISFLVLVLFCGLVKAEVVSWLTHETNSFGIYSESVTTDGGDLSITKAAALANTNFGMSILIDDLTDIFGLTKFLLVKQDYQYGYRFYIDPNGLVIPNLGGFWVVRTKNVGSIRSRVEFGYTAANGYNLELRVLNDDSAWIATSEYNITDAPHYVEVLIKFASSAIANDGYATLRIDGILKETLTNLDLFTKYAVNRFEAGAVANLDVGTSGTFFLDELIVDTTLFNIGTVKFPPKTSQHWGISNWGVLNWN